MAQSPSTSAVMALQLELKKIHEEPVEGFQVFARDDNIFEWDVVIFGPPSTLYESGYFKAKMTFPPDYPYSPPSVRFITRMWHPNVYQNGDVCISILHPPVDDPQSGELPSERWNPTQTVRTILLSVISLLNEPNTYSPANVDASVMFRRWKESRGRDKEYENIIMDQVAKTRVDAERDGVKVPITLAEYCVSTKPSRPDDHCDAGDFYVDDYADHDYAMDDEEEYDNDDFYLDDEEDSGNGES